MIEPRRPRGARVGVDTVKLDRVERWLGSLAEGGWSAVFSAEEWGEAGDGRARLPRLAGRFAAKEALMKLFPDETARGRLAPRDFAVRTAATGAPRVVVTGALEDLLARHGLDVPEISISHDESSAVAMAIAAPRRFDAPWWARALHAASPVRRRTVRDNLRRVFPHADPAVRREIGAAFHAHLVRSIGEFRRFSRMSAEERRRLCEVENAEAILGASGKGRGILVVMPHLGNWEVATLAALSSWKQFEGRFHVLRKPIFPAALDRIVTRRFRRHGVRTLGRGDGLEAIASALEKNDAVVFLMDQHAGGRDGVVIPFFGEPASTFRSVALLALRTGAAIVPMSTHRAGPGRHVLRFEDPIPVEPGDDPRADVVAVTTACNAALERMISRHPEQWWWYHRRWKVPA